MRWPRADSRLLRLRHAGAMLTLGNGTIYVDPVGNYSQLPKVDAILITDIHRDNDPATEPQQFADALKGEKGIEVRMRNWY